MAKIRIELIEGKVKFNSVNTVEIYRGAAKITGDITFIEPYEFNTKEGDMVEFISEEDTIEVIVIVPVKGVVEG